MSSFLSRAQWFSEPLGDTGHPGLSRPPTWPPLFGLFGMITGTREDDLQSCGVLALAALAKWWILGGYFKNWKESNMNMKRGCWRGQSGQSCQKNAWKSPHFPMNLSQSKYDSSTLLLQQPSLSTFSSGSAMALRDKFAWQTNRMCGSGRALTD